MKLCKTCDHLKPYDPTQAKDTKASGFRGKVCWSCSVNLAKERRNPTHTTWRQVFDIRLTQLTQELKDHAAKDAASAHTSYQ